ncbi:MAG: hypothetical protein WCI92_15430 [Bacteroidota bacterium]
MKKLISILSLVIILASFFVAGCSKNEDPIPPTITFKQDAGYVSANTTANYGDTLNFGITAKSNGTDNLAKFQIFANGQQMLDSTINTTTFALDVTTVKTILDKEVWKFVTTDIAGNSKTDSIVITGTFGEILTYSSKTLGAQSNTTEKGFISYSNSTTTQYTQDEAFNHQADIDMFCFYENTATSVNMMTLAAPGSNIKGIFTGATSVELYTVKNITFYVKTTLTAAQFDAVANDAVIRASFDPTKQFKKAKLLTAGDVYSFKLQSGKYGLLKVIAVAGAEAGTLQIAVKIQK